MSQAIELCDRVLGMVAPGVEALVSASTGTSSLTRFANSTIHQNVSEDATGVFVKVAVDGRVAGGSTTSVDDEALRRLVDRVTAAARLRPADPDWPGMAPAMPAADVDHWDDATAGADPAARAEVVRAFVQAGPNGSEAAGFCSTSATHSALATTAGQRIEGRSTQAVVDGMHRRGTVEGVGHQCSARLADLDGDAQGRSAGAKVVEGDLLEIEPGQYEVVLEPRAVTAMLTFLAIYGFGAKAMRDGMSFARLGEAQFDEKLTIRDDAAHEATTGVAYDADGTPRKAIDLVRAGVTTSLAHDRRTAKAMGAESTGHATGVDAYGPMPMNVVVEAGDTEDVVAGVERGLLVSSFHYTRVLDPRTLVVTGLSRGGLFLIEDGEVGPAVANLRFTQSYVGALGPGRVLGVGSKPSVIRSEFGASTSVTPALRLAAWNFTGGAKG